jgi:hypothetical protein
VNQDNSAAGADMRAADDIEPVKSNGKKTKVEVKTTVKV